ncbi:MAG: sigma-70 family RNA polymerase sigma factor [Myxococcota bacterium]
MFFLLAFGADAAHPPLLFRTVFKDHAAFVWRALLGLGVPRSDAEDVMQDVFMVVHKKLGGFEGRSTLRTWIYGICVRTASDWRRRAVRREEPRAEPLGEAQAPSLEERVIDRQQLARLHAALDALDPEKRAVFVLFEIEGLAMKEVADAVGCPLQTAYARLYAARKLVLERFGEVRA